MFNAYVVLFSATFFCVDNLYLKTENSDLGKAEEIQNAICSITTKELEATANATITRQLKGVCTSNELNLKIDKLQTKIMQEIDSIRHILELNGFKVPDIPLQSDNPTSDFGDFNDSLYNIKSAEPSVSAPIFKNLVTKVSRMDEILMYNDSVLDLSEGNKYFYYWRIQNVLELLSKSDMYKSSPAFTVLGHTLHLQLYPNYLDRDHFTVLLKPDSLGFIKKHRLAVLNQFDPGVDLVSGILYGLKGKERMFRISERDIRVEGFIVQNSMLVKVEIMLNS